MEMMIAKVYFAQLGDKQGKAPIDLAAAGKHEEVKQFLSQWTPEIEQISTPAKEQNKESVEKKVAQLQQAVKPVVEQDEKRPVVREQVLTPAKEQSKESVADAEKIAQLHKAVCDKDIDAVRSILADNPDNVINGQDKEGRTALFLACLENAEKIAMALLDAGADVSKHNSTHGQYPLHLVAYSNNCKLAKAIIEKGADINSQDNNGTTPLHMAVMGGDGIDMVQYLVEAGANVTAKNSDGMTACEIAEASNDTEVSTYLRSAL
jgi:ankyrin repeat protein